MAECPSMSTTSEAVEVVETWEPNGTAPRYFVTVNGFQWGDGSQGEPDSSGAWPNVYDSEAEAMAAYLETTHRDTSPQGRRSE